MQKITVSRSDDLYEAFADALHVHAWEEYLRPDPCMNLMFRSHDSGLTWEGPEETGITAGLVPSIKELANGDLLVGVTEQFEGDDPGCGISESQTVYRSSDRGATWGGPATVPNPSAATVNGEKWRLNEGDFAQMDDGSIVLYMREDGEGLSGWKSLSVDGGQQAVNSQQSDHDDRQAANGAGGGEKELVVGLGHDICAPGI